MEIIEALKKTGKTIEDAFTPSKIGDMDILKKLHMEHEEVKSLLKQLVDEESGPTRKMLLHKIKIALVPHERAEEKVVYNAVLDQPAETSKIDGEEGYVEHNLADKTLAKLSKIEDASSPEFSAAAKVLKELIGHHISEEESNIWKDVRDSFDDEERIEMNRAFEAAKKKVRVTQA